MLRRTQEPDRLSQAISAQIAIGRLAIGVGASTIPDTGLSALGFDPPDGNSRALARIAGGRDLALGALTLLAIKDRERLRQTNAACAAVDAGDAIAFAIALARREGIDRAAATGVALAVPAALVGVWLTQRLS